MAEYEPLLMAERDLGFALSTISTIEEAMPLCVETALRLTNTECGGICIFKSGNPQFIYSQGLPGDWFELFNGLDRPVSKWMQELNCGLSLYASSSDKSSSFLSNVLQLNGLKSIAVTPVLFRNQVVACLAAASYSLEEIDFIRRQALQSLALRLGGAFFRIFAEEKSKRREENYRNILDSITDAYYEVDLEGNIIRVNNSLSRTLGYKIEALLGTSYRSFCTPEVGANIYQVYNHVFTSGEPIGFFEGQMKKIDGTPFSFELSISPMYNDRKLIIGFCGIIRDVTERKKAEEDILMRNRQLVFLNTIAETASRSLELNELLTTLRMLLNDTLKVAAGAIFMYNETCKQLEPYTCWGLDINLLNELNSIPIRFLVEGQVFMDDKTISNPYIMQSGMAVNLEERITSRTVHSHVCIPLQGENEFQGVVHLFSDVPGEFWECQRVFFKAIGKMIGIAIQKIRLFEQVQTGQEQMRTLSRKLMETQENERRRLSRELHDEVGQALTALKINLQVLQPAGTESAQQIQECISIVNHTLQEIRQLALDLRPSLLDDLGLVAALRWHVDYHSRLSGLGAKFITNLSNIRLPSQLETTCYRVFQESFTNVVRHSQAVNVQVELISQDNKIHLFVRDDGLGFDAEAVKQDAVWGKGLGLLGMKERIALIGGQIEINSLAAHGTEIHAMFDWPQ